MPINTTRTSYSCRSGRGRCITSCGPCKAAGIRDAIAFGVLVGIALMSKYYALILVATCLLAALQHPSRWRYFASASPYVSAVVAAAICAPHVMVAAHPSTRRRCAICPQSPVRDWRPRARPRGRTLVGRAGDEPRRRRRRRGLAAWMRGATARGVRPRCSRAAVSRARDAGTGAARPDDRQRPRAAQHDHAGDDGRASSRCCRCC